jgi:N-acetylneuraminic acid mutarotase
MPVQIGEVFTTVVNGRIIVAGEEHDKEDFPTLEYDIATGKWSKHSKRVHPGNHHTAELIDGQVVLFGGFDNGAPGKIQAYDPVKHTWSEDGDMPWATGSACSWHIGGKVFVCGGIVGNGHGGTTDQCHTYDIASKSWSKFDSMPQGRNHAACATDGRRLWVFGGRMGNNVPQNGNNTVMVYDTQSKKWDSSDFSKSKLAPLPQRRGGTGRAVLANSEFYVFGGETGNDPSGGKNGVYDRVDIYNPVSNSWRKGASMPKGRHGMFPALHKDKIYIAGGGIHHGNSQITTFTAYCVGSSNPQLVV